MIFNWALDARSPLEKAISNAHRMDEKTCVENLIQHAKLSAQDTQEIQALGEKLVLGARRAKANQSGIDAFMVEYDLSTDEGITLMCLAEALLRIPDKYTMDRLIQDKICQADWRAHLKQSDSLFVNAATWGLLLTGKIINPKRDPNRVFSNTFKGLLNRSSEGSIRGAIRQSMKIIGKQFVLGETIEAALKRGKKSQEKGYRYSFDMLGEAAKTDADAVYYLESYTQAIHAIGKSNAEPGVADSNGISVKLSALHPRYEATQHPRVMTELYQRIHALAVLAKHYQIGLTIDAEEVDRLEISLAVIEKLALDPDLADWNGLGLALQAYQKRAFYVVDWLCDLAKSSQRRFMVRLVKGAYWDSEIKLSQEFGYAGYPVFTRKPYTDVSYIACAKKILQNTDCIYPQFASHNAHTVATIYQLAGDYADFEFQCLHGMGDALYDQVVSAQSAHKIPCRIYAPVGTHQHLLAYLVRRLLENGANSSFVNRLVEAKIPASELVQDPIAQAEIFGAEPHPHIALPHHIYGDTRMNAKGIDLFNIDNTEWLDQEMVAASQKPWQAYPLLHKQSKPRRKGHDIGNPADRSQVVGTVIEATEQDVETALTTARDAFYGWDHTPVETRAQCLEKMADLLEQHMPRFMAMAIKEAGKSIPNAISEIREAIDFCRYYAEQARLHFSSPETLPGPTGELNQLSLHGRGFIVCISPWNFPLAIFLGEVTAALAAGNTVIAKPAEQTPLIAFAAVQLLHEAGVPTDVVQLLPGTGEVVGAKLTADPRIDGVIFTGSTETAKAIQVTLAKKPGAIAPLIAETGGQNAMIVDSSALPEQVTTDVIMSAFDSAGQRCSALRVLFVQEDIADDLIKMISGAMAELKLDDPGYLSTDIGPVIDQEAQAILLDHIENMKKQAKLHYQVTPADSCAKGTFVPPTLFEINDLSALKREVFGPVLHVIRYSAKQLDAVIDSINNTGYGLTAGVHSRINATVDYIRERLRVGNLYVNRNQVGAVVGVQPFGGEGLSGTGPKAGGHMYLPRLAVERVVTTNTTASGGNASLMSLED